MSEQIVRFIEENPVEYELSSGSNSWIITIYEGIKENKQEVCEAFWSAYQKLRQEK